MGKNWSWLKMGFLSISFSPSPFLYYGLSFDMQKPSHVTNIHWKFHDFFPSSLGAIKVLHFTVRSKDGVVITYYLKLDGAPGSTPLGTPYLVLCTPPLDDSKST